jgi:hypothetical protein
MIVAAAQDPGGRRVGVPSRTRRRQTAVPGLRWGFRIGWRRRARTA